MVRAAGATATLMTRSDRGVVVMLPSGTRKTFHPKSRATLGVVAGGGIITKPFLKASARGALAKTKAENWPKITASGMNANSHPFGGGRRNGLVKVRVHPAMPLLGEKWE